MIQVLADGDVWLSLILPFTCGQRVIMIPLKWINDSLMKDIETPVHTDLVHVQSREVGNVHEWVKLVTNTLGFCKCLGSVDWL